MKRALEALGQELGKGRELEIQLLGGASGLLTGILPGRFTTGDLDTIRFRPPQEVDDILDAAKRVADRLDISGDWLNINAGLFASALPEGWEERRIDLGTFGRLHVFGLGRIDFITTKFYAHRTRDLDHLSAIKVTAEEKSLVERNLKELLEKLPDQRSKIEMAIYILAGWE
jgi:hypothetical protein